MRIITIPRSLMTTTEFNWDIDWRGQDSGQQTNAGSRQIVYNAFPRWVGSPRLAIDKEQIPLWRAIRARAQGRHSAYRVPIIDPLSFDYSSIAKDIEDRGIPNNIGVRFSTGKGMQFQPFITFAQAALAGADEIHVDVGALSMSPKIGDIYSMDDRPFVVTEVDPEGVGLFRLSIEMPLRIAAGAGDPIDLIPYGLFFTETDGTGSITYGGNWFAEAEFSFVEWMR